jgi:hypothetical protein
MLVTARCDESDLVLGLVVVYLAPPVSEFVQIRRPSRQGTAAEAYAEHGRLPDSGEETRVDSLYVRRVASVNQLAASRQPSLSCGGRAAL